MIGPVFRLRGEVDGVDRLFVLSGAETLIGSILENDIILPVKGVSRRHAVVRHLPEGLILEDLGSKNGILVNGLRVQRTQLHAGDELRLGPVGLRLEELPAGDEEMAMVLDTVQPPPVRGLPAWDTTAITDAVEKGRGGWLRIVEGVVERLSIFPASDTAGALRFLVRELHARGACLVEWSGDAEPVIVAATGDVDALTRGRGLPDKPKATRSSGAETTATLLEGDPPLSFAVRTERTADPLALLLWGAFPDRAESLPLLKTLLLLMDRLRAPAVRTLPTLVSAPVRGLVLPEGYIPGDSPAMASLHAQMKPLLQGDIPVLILGETGVGKEYVARMLHASSARSQGPFVAVNCAAIPAELLESELFGIGKGVATGVTERAGKFQLAGKGTLFLDEIGDMSLDLQAKLLRALQEKEVQPVGSSAPVPLDIRVVTATNTDLGKRMEQSRFRRDLYHRVAAYVLRVPPLRERREDIPALIEGFVRGFSRETRKSVRGVSVRALRTLMEYPWPGNVRELEHEVRRLVYLCPDGGAIDSVMLSDHFAGNEGQAPLGEPDTDLSLEAQLQKVEDRLVREALRRSGGNRTLAAKLLGISRNGLAIKMQRLGIQG